MTDDRANDRTNVGDRLIALEPLPLDYQKNLQQELQAMLVRELGKPARLFCSVVAVGSLMMAVLLAFLAVTEAKLPPLARIGLGTGTLFGLAWMIVAGRVAWRGTMDLKRDTRHMAVMAWVFTVLMMVFFLMVGMSAKDRMLGLMLITQGLAFLIGAGVYWLTYCIEQNNLTTRERFLQLELRLAEMWERQERRAGN